MEASSSSSAFFGFRDEDLNIQMKQQPSSAAPSSSAATTPPPKKKRNQPGHPNPDAEVIALSPKTLMATNRFICEVCNKGFQREQNLQLHRRGHNLPWKLRQKSTKEVRRRVYLCPEPTCVHHEPSRALGDLTGIKKHFCRKHGEKKWKCDKCPKRYAVQSDWKAHSKTCGTREYRCDCGTLFSRRDSFITHRAFCDALAQESSRLPTGLTSIGTHLFGPHNNIGLALSHGPGPNSHISSFRDPTHRTSDFIHLAGGNGGGGGGMQLDQLMSTSNLPSFRPGPSSGFFTAQDFNDENKNNFHGLIQLPDLQANNSNNTPSPAAAAAAAATFFNLSFFSNNNNTTSSNNHNTGLMTPDQFDNMNGVGNADQPNHLFSTGTLVGDNNLCSGGVSSLYNTSFPNDPILPQMSATALLQKAAQMSSTTTTNAGPSMLRGFGTSSSSTTGNKPTNNDSNLHDLMSSLASGNAGIFGNGGGNSFDTSLSMMDEAKLQHNLSMATMGGSDRFTRDFLGVGGMVRNIGRGMNPREQHHHHHHHHHQRVDMDMIDPEMKSGNAAGGSFPGGNLQ